MVKRTEVKIVIWGSIAGKLETRRRAQRLCDALIVLFEQSSVETVAAALGVLGELNAEIHGVDVDEPKIDTSGKIAIS